DVVVGQVIGDAQERLAPGVLVGRVQAQVGAARGLGRAGDGDRGGVVVVAPHRPLPFGAPGGRAPGRGVVADRRAADHLDLQVAATHEAVRAVGEIVGAEG